MCAVSPPHVIFTPHVLFAGTHCSLDTLRWVATVGWIAEIPGRRELAAPSCTERQMPEQPPRRPPRLLDPLPGTGYRGDIVALQVCAPRPFRIRPGSSLESAHISCLAWQGFLRYLLGFIEGNALRERGRVGVGRRDGPDHSAAVSLFIAAATWKQKEKAGDNEQKDTVAPDSAACLRASSSCDRCRLVRCIHSWLTSLVAGCVRILGDNGMAAVASIMLFGRRCNAG